MRALTAIADPTHRSIIEMLAVADRLACEMVAAFQMTGAAISQHLNIGCTADLVRVRTAGQQRIRSLDARRLRDIKLWAARNSKTKISPRRKVTPFMNDLATLIIVERQAPFVAERVDHAWLDPAIAWKWLFATADGSIVKSETDPRVPHSKNDRLTQRQQNYPHEQAP